ncbi:MAG TPA: hypothetical protein VGD78_15450 [Chthoniobacterales bacterium]
MDSPISLQAYRERYPYAASVPTLTQLGVIGPLLERLRQRDARQERHRAFRQRLSRAIAHPFGWAGHRLRESTPMPCAGSPPARCDVDHPFSW